jgi:predicted MPP superfamily phosphohydrolase
VWFVFVLAGLALLVVAGLYVRRRLTNALTELGAGRRPIRILRWVMLWLLYGFPVVIIVAIVISRLVDATTIPRFDGRLGAWLLTIPFAWAMLVVFQSVPWLVAIDLAYLATKRRRLRAVATVAAIGAFAIYMPIRVLAERGTMRVRHHAIGTGQPFRIGFIADVQQDAFTNADRAREVYALVNAEHPDVILSGGDWINTGPDYIEAAAAAAGTLKSPLGTFSVRGDHEHFAYVDRERSVREVEAAMRAHDVTMIADDVRVFEHAGKRVAVAFLDNNYIHHTDPVTVAALVARLAGADRKVLVTHQLDAKLAGLLAGKVDLVLAGHTHGGQVNPVLGVVHVNLARLETPYVDGRYQLGSTTMIVTAGIGYSVVPFRYASPGSVELIDLAL